MEEKNQFKDLDKIAPVILLTDIVLAGGIWFFRETFFTPETQWVAAPIAVFLMIGALIAYFVLQSLANKNNRR